jgi:hypothetical protein
MKITFDPNKNAANIEHRGLSFEQVEELDWDTALVLEDDNKDYGERRFRVFGYLGGRLHALVYTPRGDAVHVIPFRKTNAREVKRHG